MHSEVEIPKYHTGRLEDANSSLVLAQTGLNVSFSRLPTYAFRLLIWSSVTYYEYCVYFRVEQAYHEFVPKYFRPIDHSQKNYYGLLSD